MSAIDRMEIALYGCLLATIMSAGCQADTGATISGESFQGGPAIASDPDTRLLLVSPDQLVRALSISGRSKPVVVFVGPTILYRSGHIPEAKLIGPTSRPEELRSLLEYARNAGIDSEIVVYCGCCPWEHCPNVRPAFDALKKSGFSNVKILHLLHDFKRDWADQGYPVQRRSSD